MKRAHLESNELRLRSVGLNVFVEDPGRVRLGEEVSDIGHRVEELDELRRQSVPKEVEVGREQAWIDDGVLSVCSSSWVVREVREPTKVRSSVERSSEALQVVGSRQANAGVEQRVAHEIPLLAHERRPRQRPAVLSDVGSVVLRAVVQLEEKGQRCDVNTMLRRTPGRRTAARSTATHWLLEHLEQDAALDIDRERRAEGGCLELIDELGHGLGDEGKAGWTNKQQNSVGTKEGKSATGPSRGAKIDLCY